MSTELQRWARAELDLSPARPAATVAQMRPDEIAEWAEANRTNAYSLRNRLEVIRMLREHSYVVLNWSFDVPGVDARLAARAILDTSVDQLASMVSMSETVMANWRRIAATVTA